MIELMSDFIGFCLVIFLPMAIVQCFLTLNSWFKMLNRIYNKGYNDGVESVLEDLKKRFGK